MNLLIRRGSPADAMILAQFNAAQAEETEKLSLDPAQLLRGVTAVLEDPSRGFYLVAEVARETVGQALITYEWSDWRNGTFWWIQSVYVRPDHRRQGVYRRLHQHILDQAKAVGSVCGLRLYVKRENQMAKTSYERMGMRMSPYEMYETDFVIQR